MIINPQIPRLNFLAFDSGVVSGGRRLASKTGRAHSLPAPRAKPAGDPTPPLGLAYYACAMRASAAVPSGFDQALA